MKNSFKILAVSLLILASVGVSTNAKASSSSESETLEEGTDTYLKWRSRICIFGGDMCIVYPRQK